MTYNQFSKKYLSEPIRLRFNKQIGTSINRKILHIYPSSIFIRIAKNSQEEGMRYWIDIGRKFVRRSRFPKTFEELPDKIIV